MQNFGRFAVQQYLVNGINITTGVGFEYIRIINNSPYFLSLNFVGQGQVDFPECYLEDIPITPAYRGQLLISFTANLSNIAQAPSFLLSVNGYNPGEISSPQAQPLTFVSNVGNTVSTTTSGTNTLTNEGNPIPTEVMDVGTPSNAKLVDVFNDHFVWSIEQATVKHQVLKGQTSGVPLQVGQAGDTTEVLGTLQVDQGEVHANNTIEQWKDTGGTARNILSVNGSNDTIFQYTSGQQIRVQDQSNNDVLLFSNAGLTLKFGAILLLVGSMTRLSGNVSICGSGTTISHGLGTTPDLISGTPVGAQPFSATVGIGNAGTTTFQATVGAGSQIDWTAIKG